MSKEEEYLRLLAAILYQNGGRIEVSKSALDAIPQEFGVSISNLIPDINVKIVSLEADL